MQKFAEFEGTPIYSDNGDRLVIDIFNLGNLTKEQILRLIAYGKSIRKEVELFNLCIRAAYDWSFLEQFLDPNDYSIILAGQFFSDRQKEKLQTYLYKRNGVTEEKSQAGVVYLLQAGPFYKIGHSKDANKRLAKLQIQLPYKAKLVCIIPTQDRYKLEAKLHKHFSERRKNGEWFELSEADVAYIKGLAK